MEDIILTIDEDYHENGDFVKEINNNYQTYGIGIRSDVYYPPKFTISGWPNCDIDLTDMAIKKKPQPIIHTVSGKEPRSEGGKGYIVAIENNMEYRLKGTETWTTSKGMIRITIAKRLKQGKPMKCVIRPTGHSFLLK